MEMGLTYVQYELSLLGTLISTLNVVLVESNTQWTVRTNLKEARYEVLWQFGIWIFFRPEVLHDV
jgi:hypothetical protein